MASIGVVQNHDMDYVLVFSNAALNDKVFVSENLDRLKCSVKVDKFNSAAYHAGRDDVNTLVNICEVLTSAGYTPRLDVKSFFDGSLKPTQVFIKGATHH